MGKNMNTKQFICFIKKIYIASGQVLPDNLMGQLDGYLIFVKFGFTQKCLDNPWFFEGVKYISLFYTICDITQI